MTTTTRWLNDGEQAMWQHWMRFNADLAAALERGLQARAGLSTADYQVLAELADAAGGTRISDLAGSLQWEQSRTSHQLSRMEKRGLVERRPCATDRRGSSVVLTAEGQRTLRRAAPGHVDDVRRMVFDHLDDDDVAVLSDVLGRLRGVDFSRAETLC